METIHPLILVSFCSAGSIKFSTGIECTVHDATYFPSLKQCYFKMKTIKNKYSTHTDICAYIKFHILTAPSNPPDNKYC
jgi:hypothetical protein